MEASAAHGGDGVALPGFGGGGDLAGGPEMPERLIRFPSLQAERAHLNVPLCGGLDGMQCSQFRAAARTGFRVVVKDALAGGAQHHLDST